MSDETALLRAIATNPDEDTPRLAFADWLDEHGRPERAAFIRGQIELARLKEDSLHRREVAFKCRQLLDAHEKEWLDPRHFGFDWQWSRGFVETFTDSPVSIEENGSAWLYSVNPFRRVWVQELLGKVDGLSFIPADNHITALDLTGNRLNATQLRRLAKMTHFPHVRELGLMFNALRDASVRVLCDEDFFQRLDLIRLGANPFTDFGRDQLRAHFGDRVAFDHGREPERLYTIKDDYLRVGWGDEFTQFLLIAGEYRQRLAVFDHAGNLLRVDGRNVPHAIGDDHRVRGRTREAARDRWLAELGYRSAAIKVKAFRFPDGGGITPFNWWADVFDGREPAPPGGMQDSVEGWLECGKFRFDIGGRDVWLNRGGDVTDT